MCGHKTGEVSKSHSSLALPAPQGATNLTDLVELALEESVQDEAKFRCPTCNDKVKLKARTIVSGDAPTVLILAVNRHSESSDREAITASATLTVSCFPGQEYTLVSCLYHVGTNHHTASVRLASGNFVYYDSNPSHPNGLLTGQADGQCMCARRLQIII